ncbi:DUF1361 domain-containing protein [Ferruginibacter albus]|uniref:DUF1361 domain-containing protein n=1 Tax=Ferruginibacter albus TaxID=2875540 RepID=UPI001CC3F38F|nr:DUF1361 domain-containing protein [Ferruginibacter albus]UAY51674.1 DUF1361 domain-containing protein [Ferruginibacter albus]
MKHVSPVEKISFAFIAFAGCLIGARIFYSDSMMYIFLLWNLFLAWIPFQLSKLLAGEKDIKIFSAALFIGWLLFFPNSLYIVTDLMHLKLETKVPVWYDALLILSAAIAGLILAFASLYKVEIFLRQFVKQRYADAIILMCLFLGAFGVYLGRFQRWNSWNVTNHPRGLLISVVKLFVFPFNYFHAWAFTFVFAGFVFLLFIPVKYVWKIKL